MSGTTVSRVVLLLGAAVALQGCASSPPPPASPEQAPTTAPEAPPPIVSEPEPPAQPHLTQVVMGVDADVGLVQKLRLSAAPGPCTHEYGGATLTTEGQLRTKDRHKTVCWQGAEMQDSPDVIASFYDYGTGSVVFDLWLVYPSASRAWLPGSLEATLGAADVNAGGTLIWHKGDTDIAISNTECSDRNEPATCQTVSVGLTHWPTLKLSTAGVTDRATSVAVPPRPVVP